jgi:ribosomal protein S18 acetylase RimI-like enzyme
MELKLIEIDEFKKDVYKQYKKIFPIQERKSYKMLEKGYYNKNAVFYKIIEENNLVGFIITQSVENNLYVLLDYFAILPEYQCKGYGKQAIKELNKIVSQKYYGIVIEVEKLGLGKNQKENELRQRRIEFYEKLGFVNLQIDLNLFNVVFSIYALRCVDVIQDKDEVINNLFKIYDVVLGEKRRNKYCKIL